MLVLKLNDKISNKLMQQPGEKVADMLDEFLHGVCSEGEFAEKVTGYSVVYTPLACVFIETQDEEILDRIFVALHEMIIQNASTKEGALVENVWIPFQTEETPIRAFSRWYKVQHTNDKSLKEIKQPYPKIEERIQHVYENMLEIGQFLREAVDQNKNSEVFKRILHNKTWESIPAGEELMSIAGHEIQTLKEYMEYAKIPEILLEKEQCWPVEPDLNY